MDTSSSSSRVVVAGNGNLLHDGRPGSPLAARRSDCGRNPTRSGTQDCLTSDHRARSRLRPAKSRCWARLLSCRASPGSLSGRFPFAYWGETRGTSDDRAETSATMIFIVRARIPPFAESEQMPLQMKTNSLEESSGQNTGPLSAIGQPSAAHLYRSTGKCLC